MRPQDTPHDPTRTFPTYGREPEQPAGQSQPGPSQYGQRAGQPPYGQAAGPSPYGQAPGQPPYGEGVPSAYGHVGSAGYGQPPGGALYGQQAGGYGPGQYPPVYGQPAAYGYGYAGASGRTNGLATAALVCGLGGIVFGLAAPVAIGLGIAALVQISRRQQAGKGMAVAGVVIGSLVSIGYVVLIGVLIAIGTSSDDSGAPDPGTSSVYIDELGIGDCFDDTNSDDQVNRRDCPEQHDGEMVGIVSLPEGTYPGDNAIEKSADHACTPSFGTYVGKSRDESELYLSWWTPDKYTWDSGDRRVFCVAYGPDNDKLVGTVKNSHR